MERTDPGLIKALRGPQGPKGDPGEGLRIDGVVALLGDLPDPALFPDEVWMVQGEPGILYVSDGVSWESAGPIQGKQGPPGQQGPPGPRGPVEAIVSATEPLTAKEGAIWYDIDGLSMSSPVVISVTEPPTPEAGLIWLDPVGDAEATLTGVLDGGGPGSVYDSTVDGGTP